MAIETAATLSPADAARLTDFARACKAAARAVTLYPGGHPAIASLLGRIVDVASSATLQGPMRIGVLADTLLLDGVAPARADASLGELAMLLHDHVIGEITVHGGGDAEAWRHFLLLLARPSADVRAEGGISRLWTAMAGRHIALREIDFAEVLRDRGDGAPVRWDDLIASCLHGTPQNLTGAVLHRFLQAVDDPAILMELIGELERQARRSGHTSDARSVALMRLLRRFLDAVRKHEPAQFDRAKQHVATAIGQLSPEMLLALLSHDATEEGEGSGLVSDAACRMNDQAIARFVARHALTETSLDRVAQAFHALVPDAHDRARLLGLAHAEAAAASPLGSTEGFTDSWEKVAHTLMTSYSDRPFVSAAYARELTHARVRAIDVEQVNDDPPERISTWLGTVGTMELRELDLLLVLDLLRLEPDPQRFEALMSPVHSLLEDLLLVGDFKSASSLVTALAGEAQSADSSARRAAASDGLNRMVAGSLMQHVLTHIASIDDEQVGHVKTLSVCVGEALIQPLAEALASEERTRARERLTAILIAFGSIGRRHAERLKSSPNASVRRTAIFLLREFGGSEALPELTELLGDSEPRVQREAIRAIVTIGTDRAYEVLQQALAGGSEQARETIMQALLVVRDERATSLFSYMLRHVPYRGPLCSIYLRVVEALGALKDPAAVDPLKEALHAGSWWAPRRTAALRHAAAAALARIGTPAAMNVLTEAVETGSRGVRAAARAHAAGSGRVRTPARS
jgi:HEAT repeat protein